MGTLVVLATTAASAAPVGPLEAVVVVDLEFSLAITKPSTTAMTTTAMPEKISIRLRTSRRRCAARWAAIRSRRWRSGWLGWLFPWPTQYEGNVTAV